MTMRTAPYLLCLATGLAGCAEGFAPFAGPQGSSAGQVPATDAAATSDAPDDPQVPRAGGQTIASLGNPGDPGLWLRTPLVSAEGPGRITTEDGQSLSVTLRPMEGAAGGGSQMSLAAMQALGLTLTALVPLSVVQG